MLPAVYLALSLPITGGSSETPAPVHQNFWSFVEPGTLGELLHMACFRLAVEHGPLGMGPGAHGQVGQVHGRPFIHAGLRTMATDAIVPGLF